MSKRERTILIVVVSVIGLFLVDRFWFSPFLEARADILKQREAEEHRKDEYEAMIRQRSQRQADWRKVEAALKKQKEVETDALNHLVFNMVELTSKSGINLAVNGQGEQKTGAFREVYVETKFETDWEHLVDLLFAIHKSPELLRTRRIAIRSQYEKQAKLDVDLRVSTIEALPVAAKGAKK